MSVLVNRAWFLQVAGLALAGGLTLATQAVEITVKNDSFVSGGSAVVQAGFASGESAAAWLTSPCDGTIVAVQVAWLSSTGGTGQSLEDSITIFAAGTFPTPGAPLINSSNNQPAVLEGPLMTDGALNEFRFMDDQNSIPLSVPVTAGQVFVVSFKFESDPSPTNGPSVITDFGTGCQSGKNGLFAIPPGIWFNSCLLGLSGDFVIRAVVQCPDTGGCCLSNGQVCQNNMTQGQCVGAGGVYLGNNVACNANSCKGACCIPPSSCLNVIQASCTGANTFAGVGTTCATFVCFPIGACCLPNGTCQNSLSPSQCAGISGTFQGHATLCSNINCPIPDGACCLGTECFDPVSEADCLTARGVWNGPDSVCTPNPCVGTPCIGDDNADQTVNIDDLVRIITHWGRCPGCVPPGTCIGDINDNCVVNIDDLVQVITHWGACP